MLYTNELYNALAVDPCIRCTNFGVFASDQVPHVLPTNSYIIINLDPFHKTGSHWVALYKDEYNHLEFFDSYGNPPITYPTIRNIFTNKSYTFNPVKVQNLGSTVCGQYCLFFLIHRCRGYKGVEQIRQFFSSDYFLNDKIVDSFYQTSIKSQCTVSKGIRTSNLQHYPCKTNFPFGFQKCTPFLCLSHSFNTRTNVYRQ